VAIEPVSRVILDPSVLFTEEALSWLDDPELRPSLVVSQALWDRLQLPEAGDQFEPYGDRPSPDEVIRLRGLVAEIERFSGDVVGLPQEIRAIRDTLLFGDEPLADVLADEWVFLTSQSMAVIRGDAQRTLDAFRRAGAQVYTVSNELMERGLRAIRRRLPPPLLRVMKWVGRFPKRIPKVLVFGGDIALLLLPSVGLPAGIAVAVQAGIALIAGDP
jgi:hypothetical protein